MTQNKIDEFYRKNGQCCAGCDFWRWHNSVAGDCIKSNLVSGRDRASFLGIKNLSVEVESGHVITPRDYHCENFQDEK
jgi:hypothetical protein